MNILGKGDEWDNLMRVKSVQAAEMLEIALKKSGECLI